MKEFILFWMLFGGTGVQVGSQPGLDEAGCSKAAQHMREASRQVSSYGARMEIWCDMARETGKK